ncbi:CoA transferase [Amycolatopsis acidicola]|uniref:CoA transferase n=1 Tax=Amycolatopsis acidicola TaxID=2596893 RepID=A0A5N0VCK9_9PSEU|nr:CoA transferase [Amycolatopsis acidicola]KAA9163308.1 CoA transferase [Amycolatopsis acidicola]
MAHPTKPLDGIRVLDFTQSLLGPSATQVLGDYGADVIKVERAAGDLMRSVIPDRSGPDNPVFLSLNRNKRSIVLNTKTAEGRGIVHDLAARADVVVSNFRPGVMEKMGFGYDTLSELNPRIIWASGTAYGSSGPFRHRAGVDQIAQALTGLIARRTSDTAPMTIYPTMICDYTTAMHLAQGILLALIARGRTGHGQKVEVSLYDSALALQSMEATVQLTRGEELNFGRMPLNGVFPTADGEIMVIGVFHDNALQDISTALEFDDDLSERPEFRTTELQFANKDALQGLFRERLRTKPTAYWLKRLESVDIMCSRIQTIAEALRHPQTKVNDVLLDVDHPVEGRFTTVGSPIHLSASPVEIRYAPPRLGEHGDDILTELGYDQAAIDDLRTRKVLA